MNEGRSPQNVRSEEDEARFQQMAAAARRKHTAAISKLRKLAANLQGDLARHGDPEQLKRFGDLLLAGVHSAERRGDTVIVTDYFDETVPRVEIEGDRNKPLSEIAEGYFRLYVKARNGKRVIGERLEIASRGIEQAVRQLGRVDAAIAAGDEQALAEFLPSIKPAPPKSKKNKAADEFRGARRFMSSDGFEILVGKKAKDNDFLTFRVARSLDLWLHAADYPGSHVVVRNASRKEVPNQTLLEAAQLAAFYSDARGQLKAAVRYTQKKFVNKPRRSAPGLVSLASFKTILVEAKVPETVSSL